MDWFSKIKVSIQIFFIISISSCAALDIKPWSKEDAIKGFVTTIITGNNTSYGNEAACNHYKMTCGGNYREWRRDGEIACSCKDN